MPTVISIAFALFILMDPLGNAPLFLSILKDINPKKQRKIIFRELLLALFIIIICFFIGDYFLKFIKIQEHTLLISGGIILFLVALPMIFPNFLSHKEKNTPLDTEPFIVPLAIPLIAGPAVLISVILYSQQNINTWSILGAITLAWAATTTILLSSSWIQKILKEKGLLAMERLMGLLLILISVQMFLEGISLYTITCMQ